MSRLSLNKLYKIYLQIHKATVKQAKIDFIKDNRFNISNFKDYYLECYHGYGIMIFSINDNIQDSGITINEKQYLSPKEFKDIIKETLLKGRLNPKLEYRWG